MFIFCIIKFINYRKDIKKEIETLKLEIEEVKKLNLQKDTNIFSQATECDLVSLRNAFAKAESARKDLWKQFMLMVFFKV